MAPKKTPFNDYITLIRHRLTSFIENKAINVNMRTSEVFICNEWANVQTGPRHETKRDSHSQSELMRLFIIMLSFQNALAYFTTNLNEN